jgi:U4/U6 small nuclear ribonucleoprotein PRP31
MGAKRKNLAGFSTRTVQSHMGYLHGCDIIANTPPALRTRAVRLVAGKCGWLASRVRAATCG